MPKFAKPWCRKRRGWYVTLDGKQIPLGQDRKSAFEAYHDLMRQPREQKVPAGSVVSLIDQFLGWVQKNRAADTYIWYQSRLQLFARRYPDLQVGEFKPFHVQQWIDSFSGIASGTKRNYAQSIIGENSISHRLGLFRTTVNLKSPASTSFSTSCHSHSGVTKLNGGCSCKSEDFSNMPALMTFLPWKLPFHRPPISYQLVDRVCTSVRERLEAAKECRMERDPMVQRGAIAQCVVASAWMVETNDNSVDGKQRYYFREKPNVNRDSLPPTTFVYVSSFDGKTKTGWLTQERKVQYVGSAPQTIVAGKVQPILQALNDENWEESFCEMIAAIQADHATDPILKVNLLQQVLETGVHGSHCLEKAFGPHLEWIREAKINPFANWLDPADSTVASERKKAAEKLESFPAIDASITAVEQDIDMKTDRQLPEFRWVGWLRRSRDGRWECLMKSPPDGAGSLFVVCRESMGRKLMLNAIGRVNRGAAVIDATGGPSLVEGRPIYLKIP